MWDGGHMALRNGPGVSLYRRELDGLEQYRKIDLIKTYLVIQLKKIISNRSMLLYSPSIFISFDWMINNIWWNYFLLSHCFCGGATGPPSSQCYVWLLKSQNSHFILFLSRMQQISSSSLSNSTELVQMLNLKESNHEFFGSNYSWFKTHVANQYRITTAAAGKPANPQRLNVKL